MLIEAAALTLSQTQGLLFIAFVVFLRVGAAVAVMPAFGERAVPMRVRLMLALGLTVIVAPAAADHFSILTNLPPLGLVFATETIAGLAIGAGIRLFIFALQMCGSMAAQATSLAQIFGGNAADPLPAIGHIMVTSALALTTMMGLHVKVVVLFLLSYDFLPLGQFIDAGNLTPWGLSRIASAFSLSFTLAAPFVVAALIYNLALGVINKAMPQLMVAFVGAPAITLGGLVLLVLSLPIILATWSDRLDLFLAAPFVGEK